MRYAPDVGYDQIQADAAMTAEDKWVWHNGANIERTWFEENVAEARQYTWVTSQWTGEYDHVHCIVCMYAIGPKDQLYYRFEGASLCAYCFDTVIE